MKSCPPRARDAAFVHEIYHKLQFSNMNFIKRVTVFIAYLLSQRVRIKIEREANVDTVKRGFSQGLIELNKFVKKRVGKELWENEVKDLHLTKREIKRFSKL